MADDKTERERAGGSDVALERAARTGAFLLEEVSAMIHVSDGRPPREAILVVNPCGTSLTLTSHSGSSDTQAIPFLGEPRYTCDVCGSRDVSQTWRIAFGVAEPHVPGSEAALRYEQTCAACGDENYMAGGLIAITERGV